MHMCMYIYMYMYMSICILPEALNATAPDPLKKCILQAIFFRMLGLSLPPPCAELVFVSVGLLFMVHVSAQKLSCRPMQCRPIVAKQMRSDCKVP